MKVFVLAFVSLMFPVAAFGAPPPVTPQDRETVISKIVEHLKTDYVEPAVGKSAADQLQADLAAGRFAGLSEGEVFADALSARLQALTSDGHLNVDYSKTPIDLSAPADDAFGAAEMEKYYGAHLNFGVETAGRLEGNIGYLDLRVFAPIAMGADTVAAAMNVVANTDALVIDLRENGGGIGDMADLVASYLFDGGREPLTGVYDRPSDALTQRFTLPHVPGARFGGAKPVYVLTSRKTFSAAEALAYNLQALERATIVGETSGGGAHPFDYLPIHPHFVLWSVTAKSVNPITGGNWQGVGVKPDIAAPADQALGVALKEIARGG
ncbi:MAG: S41 family peptidase [Pseudomonadota bacterium]